MILLAALLSAWLQYEADGLPHARAVTTTGCPVLSVDGRNMPMHVRARADAHYDDIVCDAPVPVGGKHITIGDRTLPAPPSRVDRLVVLGDTGCRIKMLTVQNCDDPAAWPFPENARTIARMHPDLIIHVGDYLYRETACPPFDVGCAGSPFGDIAAAWKADWFTPAAPMAASAPFVFARGNHEECKRSGTGWFRYLDGHPWTVCQERSEPYALNLPALRLLILDSAAGDDQRVNDASTAGFREAFMTATGLVGTKSDTPTWLVTHRPPYLNVNERAAMGNALASFSAVLAGHIHLFAGMNITGEPPLIINGEGGDNLDTMLASILTLGLGNLHASEAPFVEPHFGFGLYTRQGDGSWKISLRDTRGREIAHCSLSHESIRCGETHG